MSQSTGWVGVDFDGTLATYEHWTGPADLGEPIKPMVDLVRGLLARGVQVKIFTARIWPRGTTLLEYAPVERKRDAFEAYVAIEQWCKEHLGRVLEITCVKDFNMIELLDDRAVQVEANTGRLIGHSTRGLF